MLSDTLGRVIDEVTLNEMDPDSAMSRALDAGENYTGEWAVTDKPSPGYYNNESGYSLFEQNNIVATGDIVINEVMPANSSLVQADDGGYYDWIEIYNRGSETVNISSYSLTDDTSYPTKWRFPDTELAAGEYLVVLASGLGDDTADTDEVKKKVSAHQLCAERSGGSARTV